MPSTDYDVAIIGSGFGGSVCAARVAQAGLRSVVLERGRWMDDAAYAELACGRSPWLYNRRSTGLLELHPGRQSSALTAAAVGGGSHIYTSVTIPAPPETFERHWPETIDAGTMQPLYEKVASVLQPQAGPENLQRLDALKTAGKQLNLPMVKLPMAIDWSNGDSIEASNAQQSPHTVNSQLVNWLRGGGRVRKKTLDTTYLKLARESGAEIFSQHQAVGIERQSTGWCVHFRKVESDDRTVHSIRAKTLVIAAGTLNTNRLLLQARNRTDGLPRLSQTLGRRYYTNGDSGAILMAESLGKTSDDGPPVVGWLDAWDQHKFYLMPVQMPLSGWRRRGWMIAVMGGQQDHYRLSLNRQGHLQVRSDSPVDDQYGAAVQYKLRKLAQALDARLIMAPQALQRRQAVTVHPLGGAAMADSPDSGVTDAWGEVFNYPGLFVADGALLPVPVGRAPSMTIAALAQRVTMRVIERCQ